MADVSALVSASLANAEEVLAQASVGGFKEIEWVDSIIERESKYETSSREIVFDGLNNKFREAARQAVADFKKKNAENQIVAPNSQRGTENSIIVESLARGRITGVNSWAQTGLTAGSTINLLPTGSGNHTITRTEQRYLITDVVEHDPAAGIDAVKFVADDDQNVGAQGFRNAMRAEDAVRKARLDLPVMVNSKVDWDGRLEDGTSTEMTPVGLYIATGNNQKAI